MTKSQPNNSHKDKEMEFKNKDEVVIVDETKTTVFEAKQVKTTYPCEAKTAEESYDCNKRWLESLSDCA
jgi:hypothetical protein